MDSDILLARTNDIIETVFKTNKPKYLGFLSNEEKAFVKKHIDNRNVNYRFFGGDEDCERVFLGCLPDWMEVASFPITAVTFVFRSVDALRHRDFLGSLMALGLKREAVGDILIEKGRAVAFLSRDIAPYVIENLKKVGNVGVTASIGCENPLPERGEKIKKQVTVASLRLDCIVSAFADCSRNTACEFIESGLVSVNSVITEKPTKSIVNGDVLSIRRKGKFEIVNSDKKTKKDRFVLVYRSY